MLKAIFFDIDDTLYSTTKFADDARRASIDAMITMGLKIDPEEGYRELVEVITEFSSNYGAHYDKFLSRIPPDAMQNTNPSLLVAAAVVAYHETKFRELSAYEDVTTVMKLLSEKTDLVLGIISSGLRVKQAEKLIRLGVWRFIHPDAVFITDAVGIGKPNPKLYLRACDSVGANPSEAMHVGDHPLNDIDPANAIGMISVWSKREGKHIDQQGKTDPDHVIFNFWDLLDLLQSEKGIDLGVDL